MNWILLYEEKALATYILLLKEFEDEESVVYKFGPNKNTMGKVKLNKITRNF